MLNSLVSVEVEEKENGRYVLLIDGRFEDEFDNLGDLVMRLRSELEVIFD